LALDHPDLIDKFYVTVRHLMYSRAQTAIGLFMRFVLIIVLALMPAMISAKAAESPRSLEWENLMPEIAPLPDPFPELTPDEKLELQTIISIRRQAELGMTSKVSATYELSVELEHKFRQAGYNIDQLLAKALELKDKSKEFDEAVVDKLDGQLIKIPGYALPLEFVETGVTDFLLVPYLGACIHTPPPPNQMVFVRLTKAYKIDDVYAPVFITGRIRTQGTTRSLSYVDGQAKISTGYTIDAILVKPYVE
jgi:hypothetical protein